MINRDFLLLVETLSNEKSISKEAVFKALEVALASALRKKSKIDQNFVAIEVCIDRGTGDYKAFKYTSDAAEAFDAETDRRDDEREPACSVHRDHGWNVFSDTCGAGDGQATNPR